MSVANMDNTDDFIRGDKTRREVLGDAHVDRFVPERRRIHEALAPVRDRGVLGKDLPRGQAWTSKRGASAPCAPIAMGDLRELRIHLKGLLRLGVHRRTGGDLYPGRQLRRMPRAGSAFEVAREVLAEIAADAAPPTSTCESTLQASVQSGVGASQFLL